MKSEFRQIEVFITTDGEEYLDEDTASSHQEYLDAKYYFNSMVDCREEDNKEVIERMFPYLKKIIKEI